jgi:ligand-binding sensor domain-containing protein/serine phosphatase RsbU (regulator of sigma subunit)
MKKCKAKILICVLFLASCTSDKETNIDNKINTPVSSYFLDTEQGYSVNTYTGDSIKPLIDSNGEMIATGTQMAYSPTLISDNFVAEEVLPLGQPSKTIQINSFGELESISATQYSPYSQWTTHIVENENSTVFESIDVQSMNAPPVKTKPLRYKDDATHNIQLFDVDQGLSTSYIYSLLQDRNDNIWIGYWGGGISKYDGVSINNYNVENGLSGNTVLALIEDSQNNIWVGTMHGGVSKFDGSNFTYINSENGLESDVITALFEDKSGNIWIGTSGGGISKFDGKHIINYSENEGLLNNTVRGITEDSEGLLWIATDMGINTFDGYEFRALTANQGLNSNATRCIFHDSKKRIWIGTNDGLTLYHQDSIYNYSLGRQNKIDIVNNICEDLYGRIWVGTDGGGTVILDGRKTEYLSVDNGLSSNVILRMMNDNVGNTWIGTFGAGISLVKNDRYRHYGIQDGLSSDFVRSIVEDPKGNMWLGSDGGGLIQFDGNTFKEYSKNSSVGSHIIMEVESDKNGTIWFAPYLGQICQLENGRIKRFGIGSTENEITDIFIDNEAKIWVGTHKSGVYIIDGDSLYQFSEEEGLSSNYVLNIFQDQIGNVWISTANSGVCKIKQDTYTIYSEKEGLSANNIKSVMDDDAGRIWLGTGKGGINVLYNDSIKQITVENGLPSNTVQSINYYGNKIWGSSENGVFCIFPNNQIFSYNKEDGVKGLDHYEGSSYLDSEGSLWWGSGKGLTSLDIKNKFYSKTAPGVRLVNIEIQGKFYDYQNFPDTLSESIQFISPTSFYNVPEGLKLSYEYNHLTFYYSGIDWTAPHDLKYSYRVNGLDNNWSQPSSETKAEYRNLPSGEFTFQVKTIGKSGEWSEPFSYSFRIEAPWWQTIWAYLIYILIGILLVAFLFRLRTAQLKKRQVKLEKEVDIATEEIRLQKEEIEIAHQKTQKQKSIIETAHTEIKDSMEYAKRIQSAILPPPRIVKEYLNESFILYKPKDIVAGDFYWMEQREGKTLFAAADCTGHGVPGAMVSVICNGALNRSVREFGLTDPGEVLGKVREIVIQEFEKSDDEVKDGMDIALCSIDGNKLKYAGAHNPLWLIRNGEIIETKADKQPIGKYDNLKPYQSHSIDLEKGDSIYVFSDGYVDQFGGEKGKKFKAKAFRSLLLSIQDKSMDEQKALIDEAFESWRGSLEQIDDVCVIGVRM